MSLLEQVKEAGVIGAGGAGFPTHAKLNCKAEYILMNGAECEPLLRVDQQLMAMYPDEIIKGFKAAGELVGAKKAIIGIKGKHHDVIEILEEHIKTLGVGDYVSVGILPDIYPAGDEQVLVYQLTGRVVPEAGIPINVGCVVINSETCLNVYHAQSGKAVTEKYITLAGDIPQRKTVKVPVGTPVLDVLKMSGIEDFSNYGVVGGGPMMGPLLTDLSGYITKKDKGFIILKKDHPLIKRKSYTFDQARRINRSACEQCRMCTDLCPRYLLGHNMQPHKMMRVLSYAPDDIQAQLPASLCCQCNLCEYFSCPANLHPRLTNAIFKQNMAEAKVRYQPTETEFHVRDARKYRLVPSKRLVARLGLREFDQPAPWTEETIPPAEVHIATSQHVGAPAVPVVSTGDRVTAGQLIGKVPDGALGAPIHASVSGTVSACGNDFIVIRMG